MSLFCSAWIAKSTPKTGGTLMPTIRIPKERWGDVWRVLIDIGEIQRVLPIDEKVYIVSEQHIEYLEKLSLPYEEVSFNSRKDSRASSCKTV
jgi:hypothetical protein